MSIEHDSGFDALLARMAEEVITPEEQRELGQLMQGDTTRQRLYHDYLLNHLLLEQEGLLRAGSDSDWEADVKDSAGPAAAVRLERSASARSKMIGRNGIRYALAATVLLVVSAAVLVTSTDDPNVELATVIDAIGVEDAPRELTTEGAILDVGLPLRFSEGLISIAMPSGAQMVLEGPASLVVRGPNRVQLDEGKLYATVPPQAVGFSVENAAATLVDLGTEFGVRASPRGDLESYVFLGRIRAETDERRELLDAGQSVAASTATGLGAVRAFDPDKTSFARSLDGADYLGVVERLEPLYLHRFSPGGRRRVFSTTIGSSRYTVRLSGGVYAAAGGPIATPQASDGYLRFVGVESTTSTASASDALERSGEYSIVAWVRVDESGPQGIATLAGRGGAEKAPGVVLRVTDDGRLEHRCHGGNSSVVRQTSARALPQGRWAHVVVTGGSNRDLRLYVNGRSAAAASPMTADLRPECGRLLLGAGSGRRLDEDLHTGPLRGAIDEVGVFDRCLTQAEVRELYSASPLSTTSARL